MCGRFAFYSTIKAINKAVNITKVSCDFEPSYNVAPMSEAVIVTDKREAVKYRWGLVPFFAKDKSYAAKMINARSETIAEKPSFRNAYLKRRCIVPANGFFEWKRSGKTKEPFYFYIDKREVLCFAGIYEICGDYRSFSIITRASEGDVSKIHQRMPIILRENAVEKWLDTEISTKEELDTILKENYENSFISHRAPVTVNSVRNNTPDLVEPDV